jgi:hypothetical protein
MIETQAPILPCIRNIVCSIGAKCDDGFVAIDQWSDVIALFAGVVGLVVVLMVFAQRRSSVHVARDRHPSASPPVTLAFDHSDGETHWRITNRTGILDTAVDIVTFRPSGTSLPWVSEPIVDPVVLGPGESVLLSSVVSNPTVPYDVVVGWTVRHLDGDVMGSRTITVAPDVIVSALATRRSDQGWSFTFVDGLMIVLLAIVVLAAGRQVLDEAEEDSSSPATNVTTMPQQEPTVSAPTTTAEVVAPPTTSAATTTSTATTAATTVPPKAPATTAPATTAGTSTTSTTVASTAPPAGDGTRKVVISGRVEDCRFGAACVIAGFTLEGFEPTGEYVCEFDDGSRFVFRYVGNGAQDACAVSGPSPSITIEVDGVRSATITRESPDGG